MGGRRNRNQNSAARRNRQRAPEPAPSRSQSSENEHHEEQCSSPVHNGVAAVAVDEGVYSESQPSVTVTSSSSVSVCTQTAAGDPLASSVADVTSRMSKMCASMRLETMSQVLYTLTPLEVRFVGSCLENVARKDSQSLRDWEERLNDPDTVRHLTSTCDLLSMLSFASIGLSVLHSTNRRAAVAYSEFLHTATDSMEQLIEQHPVDKRPSLIEQLRLVIAAATYHPAFMMDQRLEMERARTKLDQLVATVMSDPVPSCSSLASSSTATNMPKKFANNNIPLYVLAVDVDDPPNDSAPAELSCQVTWIDGLQTWCVKSLEDVRDFHYRLLDAFPMEAGYQGAGRLIPYLSKFKSQDLTPSHFAQYLRLLSDMPARMLLSPVVTSFFWSSRSSSSTTPPDSSTEPCSSVTLSAVSLDSLASSLPTATLPVDAPAVSGDVATPSVELHVRLPMGRQPTCPNCAQPGHVFAECMQISLHEIAATGDFKLKWHEPPPPETREGASSHKRHSSASARVPSRAPLLVKPDSH